MLCVECNGERYTWYGNRSTYAVCEICGGTGYLDDRGGKTEDAGYTPLWPVHDEAARRRRYGG